MKNVILTMQLKQKPSLTNILLFHALVDFAFMCEIV
jgi:hypothetical protein